MKIMLFIRSTGIGGAERQILILACELAKKYDVTVVTFYDNKEPDFLSNTKTSVKYITLNKKGRWDILGFFTRLLKTIRRVDPDVIYAFMNTASIFSLIAKLVKSNVKVVWGVRSSNMNLSLYGPMPSALRWLECRLSSAADLVISNSYAGRDEAIDDGYSNKSLIVIPNGIDTSRFKFDLCSRHYIRKKYRISPTCNLIGVVARHDPMKGLEYFLRAAAIHLKTYPQTHFLIVGYGNSQYTDTLKLIGYNLGLSNNVTWVGTAEDVAPFYSAMDIYTSSSIFGEGFSNTIGEAMSCQLPVVVTDVGDASYVIGGFGRLIPPKNPIEIAAQWSNLLDLEPQELMTIKAHARDWVAKKYSVRNMVKTTEAALVSVTKDVNDKRV